MKSVLFLLALAASALAAPAPNTLRAEVHKVYLLSMSNGLDQYLADHLTTSGIFVVVTDPAKADAVFTDRLGRAFERRFEELYPKPKPPAKKSETEGAVGQQQERPPISSFHAAKGTVFLVGVKTQAVLWSIYDRPRNSMPDEMNRTAADIVARLHRALKRK